MGAKLERISRDEIKTAGDALKKVAEAMITAAADMQQFGLEELGLAWSQRQWDCLQIMITLGVNISMNAPGQIIAHQLKKEPIQKRVMDRSAKDRAKREAKRSESNIPIKPPGRPRKSSTE